MTEPQTDGARYVTAMDPSDSANKPHDGVLISPGALRGVAYGKTPACEATGPGHVFEYIIALDRVHLGNTYGDQHNHYYAAPISRPTANQEEVHSLKSALYFSQMNFRSSTVAVAYSDTCKWLFDTFQYKRWRDQRLLSEHIGFLWIKGKPGAGKSTVRPSKKSVRR